MVVMQGGSFDFFASSRFEGVVENKAVFRAVIELEGLADFFGYFVSEGSPVDVLSPPKALDDFGRILRFTSSVSQVLAKFGAKTVNTF